MRRGHFNELFAYKEDYTVLKKDVASLLLDKKEEKKFDMSYFQKEFFSKFSF